MQSVKHVLEWYLGVPASGPGKGTSWRIVWQPIGPASWPEALFAALAVVVVLAVALFSLYETRRLRWRSRAALLFLRLGAVGIVGLMGSQLSLAIDRTGLPILALLIDDSASMGIVEPSAEGQSPGSPARLDRVQSLLGRDDGRFLDELRERFRLRVYRFDKQAHRLTTSQNESDQAETGKRLRNAIQTLKAQGSATDLAAAARHVLDDLRGLSPSAIVLFTDGVPTTGREGALSAAAALAARRGVPLFPVGVGQVEPPPDLDLFELAGDEVGFWKSPVRVSARFRTFGLEGKRVTITLVNTETGEQLAEATTKAGLDGQTSRLELTFIPETKGQIEFEARARLEGPEANTKNNIRGGAVRIRKEALRVLLADHAPRYEFRFLKTLLRREPTIDLDTVLQESDLGYARQDETGLDRFPLQREEIFQYDVIIFGDLDPSLLGGDVLAALADFVRTEGGGFIGIAGPRFFPRAYAGTPLEPVLPVDPGSVTVPPPETLLNQELDLHLTIQGRRSGPMFRFAADERVSDRIWETLPGIYWYARAEQLTPGAVPLASVTNRRGYSEPVIILRRLGAGQVLLHLFHATWRWRFRSGDAYFGRYWIQAIRYLSSIAERGPANSGGISLTSTRRRYQQGAPVMLRARVRSTETVEGGLLRVVVEDQAGTRRKVALRRSGPVSNLFEGRLDHLPAGTYHAWVRTARVTEKPATTEFEIAPPRRELSERRPDFEDLRRAARQSGGRYFSLAEAAELPRRLPAGEPIRLHVSRPFPLWSRPELLIALIGVLALEWWLRKRGRLS